MATASGAVPTPPVVPGSGWVERPGERLPGVSSAAAVVSGTVTWVPSTAWPEIPPVVDGAVDGPVLEPPVVDEPPDDDVPVLTVDGA
jgi:hypothetical protein